MTAKGAPGNTKYKPEFVEIARELAVAGATDREICAALDIGNSAFYAYCNKYPEFNDAVKVGKAKSDDRVERTLYARAMGMWVDEEKSFMDRKTGQIVKTTEKKFIPPEPHCMMFWLKARRPDVWREVTRQELTGPNGGPVSLAAGMSDIEIARRIAFAMKSGELALEANAEPVLIEAKPLPQED